MHFAVLYAGCAGRSPAIGYVHNALRPQSFALRQSRCEHPFEGLTPHQGLVFGAARAGTHGINSSVPQAEPRRRLLRW